MWVTDLKLWFKSVDNDKRQQTTKIPILLDLLEPSIQSFYKKDKVYEFSHFYFENKIHK